MYILDNSPLSDMSFCHWGQTPKTTRTTNLQSPFRRLQVCSSRCFWCLSPVAKVGSVGCVDFLVEGSSACVLMDEAGFCLSGRQVHVWWCVLGCLWPSYDYRQPLC